MRRNGLADEALSRESVESELCHGPARPVEGLLAIVSCLLSDCAVSRNVGGRAGQFQPDQQQDRQPGAHEAHRSPATKRFSRDRRSRAARGARRFLSRHGSQASAPSRLQIAVPGRRFTCSRSMTVVGQFGGTLDYDWEPDGLSVAIKVSIANLSA